MKHTTTPHFVGATAIAASLVTAMAAGTSADAATLESSALNQSQIVSGGNAAFGIFIGSTTTGATTGGVTTSLVGVPTFSSEQFTGPGVFTFHAVDAANGMDLTYTVTVEAFRYDTSAGVAVGETFRANGGRATVRSIDNNNTDRDEIAPLTQGDTTVDYEFIRFTVGNVVNSGTTAYALDGIVSLSVNNADGVEIRDFNNADDVIGSVSGGGNQVFDLDSPSTAFDYYGVVAPESGTAFQNRLLGFSVQFSDAVPEPGSLALLGLGGLCMLRRRR